MNYFQLIYVEVLRISKLYYTIAVCIISIICPSIVILTFILLGLKKFSEVLGSVVWRKSQS